MERRGKSKPTERRASKAAAPASAALRAAEATLSATVARTTRNGRGLRRSSGAGVASAAASPTTTTTTIAPPVAAARRQRQPARRKPAPLGQAWLCSNCDYSNSPIQRVCLMCSEGRAADTDEAGAGGAACRSSSIPPTSGPARKRSRKLSDSWQDAAGTVMKQKQKVQKMWNSVLPCTCPHINSTQCELLDELTRSKLLQPDNWHCADCSTTDSIWACLHCGHIACGRTVDAHAYKHAEANDHYIVIELTSKYVHCYRCEDFAANDTPMADISHLRDSLAAVEGQTPVPLRTRSGLRALAATPVVRAPPPAMTIESARERDILQTAIFRWRSSLLFRAFNTWRADIRTKKAAQSLEPATPSPCPAESPKRKPKLLAGLRNLGNTCYMNSVLQSLAHTQPFCVGLQDLIGRGLLEHEESGQEKKAKSALRRRTSVDCRDLVEKKPVILSRRAKAVVEQIEDLTFPELCRELASLFRVMTSGKFAIITPLAMQGLVWRIKPDFRGYTQQDAQELLLAYQERWEGELTKQIEATSKSRQDQERLQKVMRVMQGRSIQTVTCGHCSGQTTREDTFSDVSLDLTPEGQKEYDLLDLIKGYSAPETIEGYHCNKCSVSSSGSRRSSRAAAAASTVSLRTMEKKVEIAAPAEVMRFHLKRFVWAGVRRHKVRAKVEFPFYLDMSGFVVEASDGAKLAVAYNLVAIICHQGTRMTSGHFYAHCKTEPDGEWMLFNDRNVTRETEVDVLKDACTTGYILIYTRA